jgi:hypothetical protein
MSAGRFCSQRLSAAANKRVDAPLSAPLNSVYLSRTLQRSKAAALNAGSVK